MKPGDPVDHYLIGEASILIWLVSRGVKPLGDILIPRDCPEVIEEVKAKASRMSVHALERKIDDERTVVYFYREPWLSAAIEFISDEKLSHYDRSWIQGLLYGVRTDLIQKFLDANDHPND